MKLPDPALLSVAVASIVTCASLAGGVWLAAAPEAVPARTDRIAAAPALPAAQPDAVFIGVAPNAPDRHEPAAPTF